jgi:uncharacterized protein (DUF885 family)
MILTRRTVLGASAATIALAAAGCNQASTTGANSAADQQLNTLLDRIATTMLSDAPEYATSLAVDEARAGGRYIDRLTDQSKAGSHARLQKSEQAVTDLQAISRDTLSDAGKVSYRGIVTHEFALDDVNDALDLMRSGTSGRILLNIS